VKTVEPKLATGKLHTIWIAFAKFYENNGQLDDVRDLYHRTSEDCALQARAIFEKGLEPLYVKVDDLASVWCEYVEFELRHK
jgi:pre-mRNA-splicing factor SYF1